MGPYYLTAAVCLLGPGRQVTRMARILYPERTPDTGPHKGETFKVSTPTFVACLIEFEGGAPATLLTSFGIWGADPPYIQLYCPPGILGRPHPNKFDGPVTVRSHAADKG